MNSRNLYGLVKNWRIYPDEQIEGMDDVHNVRRATKTGRPAGNHNFVKKIEELTTRVLQREKSGPKKKQKG